MRILYGNCTRRERISYAPGGHVRILYSELHEKTGISYGKRTGKTRENSLQQLQEKTKKLRMPNALGRHVRILYSKLHEKTEISYGK